MSQSNSTLIQNHIYRKFNVIKKVGSGAYGHVWKVQDKSTKKLFALKKIFDAFQHSTDAQRTYRQIEILKQTQHMNIIKLYDTLKADNGKDVYLIFQYMQSDLHNVIASDILKDIHIRFIIYQVAKALKYLHTGFVIHRDLKPSNILVNSDCTIKLCDFGLVRSIFVKDQTGPILTEGVATRWYRAPEVLLGSKSYSTPADVWSFGCIIYETLTKKPLFSGSSTMDQIQKICQLTGFPSEEEIQSLSSQSASGILGQLKISHFHRQSQTVFKEITSEFRELLKRIIIVNPLKRITIQELLNHECLKMFHKPQQEVKCPKQLITEIDDNKKLSVDEYRKLIYGQASNNLGKIKTQLIQIIAKCNSAKIIKTPNQFASGCKIQRTISSTSISKPELTKKQSFHTFKPFNKTSLQGKITTYFNHSRSENPDSIKNAQVVKKLEEKQSLKFIKTAKQKVDARQNKSPSIGFFVKKQSINQKSVNNKSCTSLEIQQIQKKQTQFKSKQIFSTDALLKNLAVNKSLPASTNKVSYVPNRTFFPSKLIQQSPCNQLGIKKSISSHNRFPQQFLKGNNEVQKNQNFSSHAISTMTSSTGNDQNPSNSNTNQPNKSGHKIQLSVNKIKSNNNISSNKIDSKLENQAHTSIQINSNQINSNNSKVGLNILSWNLNKTTLNKQVKNEKQYFFNSQKHIKIPIGNPETNISIKKQEHQS